MGYLDRISFDLPRKYKWLILGILFISTLMGYVARMSVSVALKFISSDFGWSASQEGSLGGILLGIFLVSYGFSNVLLSPYIDKLGPKKALTFAISAWSLSVIFGAFFGNIYWMFLFSRVLLGLGQGVLFPTASKVTAGWFKEEQRARANSIFLSGGPFGSMLSPLILTPIIVKTSWEITFYLFALLSLSIIIPVLLFIQTSPKGVKQKQKEKTEEVELNIREDMKVLLKNRQFQIILIGFISMISVWWGIGLWLPTYLVEAQGLSISEMTFGASVPYLASALGMFSASWISDHTGERKKIIVIALISTTAVILSLTMLDIQSKIIAILLLSLIFFLGQMSPPIFFALIQTRISEEILGSATGIMNGIGNGIGVIGPVSIGFIVAFTGSYNLGLIFLGSISLVGGILFQIIYKTPKQSEKILI